jgi:hypothetical protein
MTETKSDLKRWQESRGKRELSMSAVPYLHGDSLRSAPGTLAIVAILFGRRRWLGQRPYSRKRHLGLIKRRFHPGHGVVQTTVRRILNALNTSEKGLRRKKPTVSVRDRRNTKNLWECFFEVVVVLDYCLK